MFGKRKKRREAIRNKLREKSEYKMKSENVAIPEIHTKDFDEIEEHIDDSRRAADGRLILAGGELAENGNIHGVEQLLQDAAERQRQGKQPELAQKPAVQHVDLIAFDG